VSSVDDIRFIPCCPVHWAVARDPAPHQIRSRSPAECGSGRSSPVDDGRPDLDPLRPRPDRGQQRERRRELLGEMVDPEVGAVGTQVLDRLGELDRLDERIRRRPHLRVG